MLDNLRAMAVFVSVADQGSFGGAAKELGITTSAVSQQVRALELNFGVTLLHRSTRKLSLTEAGASLYESAKNMVKFAEEAKDSVSQLRDGLLGNLRIATTPQLAHQYIVPALSHWLDKHNDLSLRILTANEHIDMIDERVDLAIYFSSPDKDAGVPLLKVKQHLLAAPDYLLRHDLKTPKNLARQHYIGADGEVLALSGTAGKEIIRPNSRFVTNDTSLALQMASQGYGVVKSNHLDAKTWIDKGELVAILTDYQLPELVLYAKTLNKEQQPAKVWRCIEVLTEYFTQLT